MKLILGATAAGLLVTGLLAWQLHSKTEALALTRDELSRAQSENDMLLQRVDALDRTLSNLATRSAEAQQRLQQTVNDMHKIRRTEHDTQEQIDCLDVVVPAGLDERL